MFIFPLNKLKLLGQFNFPTYPVSQTQMPEAKDYQPSSQLDCPHARTGCFEHSHDALRKLHGSHSCLLPNTISEQLARDHETSCHHKLWGALDDPAVHFCLG